MRTPSRRTQIKGESMRTDVAEQHRQRSSVNVDELTGGIGALAAQVVLPLAVLAIVLMAGLSLGQAGGSSDMYGKQPSHVLVGSPGRSER
ncbi:MAG: hypothetical protein EPO21_03725 [Chloroflexota bacterium]|nr:MAG: hypothetical protein EPO21_03725 [Chloroflexota bacterium]